MMCGLWDDEERQHGEEQRGEADDGQDHQLQRPVVRRQHRGAQVDQQDAGA